MDISSLPVQKPLGRYNSVRASWERLFIRSGIRCFQDSNGLRLLEAPDNLGFVHEILASLRLEHYLSAEVFHTTEYAPSDRVWLDVRDSFRGGAEAGPVGFENIELRIMDTHISGVIRWLNALGYTTTLSCEGHRPQQPCRIVLLSSQEQLEVSHLIREISAGELNYSDGIITEQNRVGKWVRPAKASLLDLGERLYNRYSDVAKPATRP